MVQAFAYNFLSALSAVIGTIIMLALKDTLTDVEISVILLMGAGTFMYIALPNLIPEALLVSPATAKLGSRAVLMSQICKLISFIVGTLIIGVPLIFDQHCEAGGHAHHDH